MKSFRADRARFPVSSIKSHWPGAHNPFYIWVKDVQLHCVAPETDGNHCLYYCIQPIGVAKANMYLHAGSLAIMSFRITLLHMRQDAIQV